MGSGLGKFETTWIDDKQYVFQFIISFSIKVSKKSLGKSKISNFGIANEGMAYCDPAGNHSYSPDYCPSAGGRSLPEW